MTLSVCESQSSAFSPSFPGKLWIYTNYDCNLSCPYCVARSSPGSPRRAIGLANVKKLVDEAAALGFGHIYLTGGEPLVLNDIYEMLAYASQRLPTTVLTNAMLLRGARLERLRAIRNDNLIVQVSLDGGRPEHHDPYRGAGSWLKTVEGIRGVMEAGLSLRLSTTTTPANAAHLDRICEFHLGLGIREEDHFIRPLAKRGCSREGLEIVRETMAPEITVNQEGVYWHPLATDADMLVCKSIFPLAAAVALVKEQLANIGSSSDAPLRTFN
jgi:MoaA/NifB/PqqE/SkfB family radical SAM enzyme